MHSREKLLSLIKEKALLRGEFTLASGKKSNYYINVKKIILDSEGCFLSGKIILDMLGADIIAVGGVPVGAIPLVASVLLNGYMNKRQLKGFIVRKDKKDYGTGRQIEGDIFEGENAVLLEDVVTTGGSLLKALKISRENGINIKKVISVVDRSEGEALKLFQKEGIVFKSIFNIKEILD